MASDAACIMLGIVLARIPTFVVRAQPKARMSPK